MRDHEQGHFGLRQMPLKPLDHVEIQVIGGFVKEKNVRFLNQNASQSNSPPFAAT